MPPYEDFSSEDLAEEIWAMTEREEPSMVKAFLAAMASLIGVSTVYRLTQRVDDGEIMGMSEIVNDALAQVEVDSGAFAPVQQSVMQQAGQLTADAIGPAYNGVSPRALTAASNITSYLVRYVSESIQENLRQIIRDQIEGVITRDEARRRIRQQVGLLPQHALAVQNLESNLLASGMSIAQAQAQAAAYAERLLRYRAEMISRTEVARAASVGQQEYWEQLADDGFLPPNTLRKWIVTPDEKLCEICGPMDDLLIPLDGFWNLNNGDQVYYPTDSHPNCRCSMGLVFPDQFGKADPLGLQRWLAMRPTVVKHANHDQKTHGNWAKGRSGKPLWEQVEDAWDAILKPSSQSDVMEAFPERFEQRYLAERGVKTKYLKIGETITRSEQTPDGRWQLYDITPWDTKNLGSPYAGDNRPTTVPGSRGNDMSNPNVRVEGSERPGDFVYRVMAESEYQQAIERGYFRSDQRMNLGNEGTVFSKDKTGTFYWPKEEPARIVRFKYDPEIMYFDKADEYIKTGSHYVDTGEGGYNRTEVNPVIKPVPFDLVDEVSALLPSKNDIQADRDERQKVGKHASHDQKSHGNWATGRTEFSDWFTEFYAAHTKAEILSANASGRRSEQIDLLPGDPFSGKLSVLDGENLVEAKAELEAISELQKQFGEMESRIGPEAGLPGLGRDQTYFSRGDEAAVQIEVWRRALRDMNFDLRKQIELSEYLADTVGLDLLRAEPPRGKMTAWADSVAASPDGGVGFVQAVRNLESGVYDSAPALAAASALVSAHIQKATSGADSAKLDGSVRTFADQQEQPLPYERFDDPIMGLLPEDTRRAVGSVIVAAQFDESKYTFEEALDETIDGLLPPAGETTRRIIKQSLNGRIAERIYASSPAARGAALVALGYDDPAAGSGSDITRLYRAADAQTRQWATSSASEGSAQLQKAVAYRVGSVESWDRFAERQDHVDLPSSNFAEAYAEAVYAETQALLALSPETSFRATRGISLNPRKPQLPLKVVESAIAVQGKPAEQAMQESSWRVSADEIGRQPLSSWSTSTQVANQFADMPPNVGKPVTKSVLAVVQRAMIPDSQVFSTALTGPGCFSEQEIIVIEGTVGTTSVSVVLGDGSVADIHTPERVAEIALDSAYLLDPIDRDGDGWIYEGTDQEQFVGKADKKFEYNRKVPEQSRTGIISLLTWIPDNWDAAYLDEELVAKHGDHDQKSHGNWARGVGVPEGYVALSAEEYAEWDQSNAPRSSFAYSTKAGFLIDSADIKPTNSPQEFFERELGQTFDGSGVNPKTGRPYNSIAEQIVSSISPSNLTRAVDQIFGATITTPDGKRTITCKVLAVTEKSGQLQVDCDISLRDNQTGRIFHTGSTIWRNLSWSGADGKVKNRLFTLAESLQEQGFGSTLLRHWEDQQALAGFDEAVVHAVSNYSDMNGGYVWLKTGYEPKDPDLVIEQVGGPQSLIGQVFNFDIAPDLKKQLTAEFKETWEEAAVESLGVGQPGSNVTLGDIRAEIDRRVENLVGWVAQSYRDEAITTASNTPFTLSSAKDILNFGHEVYNSLELVNVNIDRSDTRLFFDNGEQFEGFQDLVSIDPRRYIDRDDMEKHWVDILKSKAKWEGSKRLSPRPDRDSDQRLVRLDEIDRDGDGIILEGTEFERFVGKSLRGPKAPKSIVELYNWWVDNDPAAWEKDVPEVQASYRRFFDSIDKPVEKHADHDQKTHGNWAKGRKKKQAARRVLVGAAALKPFADREYSRPLGEFYAEEYGWQSDKPMEYEKLYEQSFSPFPFDKERQMWPPETYEQGFEEFKGNEEEWEGWKRKKLKELGLDYEQDIRFLDWEGGEYFGRRFTDYKRTSDTEPKDAHEAVMGLTRSGGGLDFKEFTENYEPSIRTALGGFRGYTLNDLDVVFWNGWRQSPYEDSSFPANRVRTAMHIAAVQLFNEERNMESWLKGVREYRDGNPGDPYAIDAYRASELIIAPDERQQKGVQAARGWWEHNYAETQKAFADAGVTHVALTRGYTKRFEGDTVTPREATAVSSWTANPEMAARFAGGFGVFDPPPGYFNPNPPWRNTRGTVVYDLVPVEDIALVIGGTESEVVVINRPGKSYPSMTFPEGTQDTQAAEIISSRLQGMIDRDNDGIVGEGTDQERFVGKHANHDQKTHGNWARGRSLDVIKEFDWKSKGMESAQMTYNWLDANGVTVFPSQPGVGTAFFTSRAGELPGKAIVRNDSGEMEVVDITISDPFTVGGWGNIRNPKLTPKQKKAILDTLNKISPEFRPTHVKVAAKSNIGGGWYVQNQDVLRSNEIVISLWSIPGIFENDEVWEVFKNEPELAAAIGKPLDEISRWKKYIQTLQTRPSEEAWGHLEKTVIHEAGHAAERRMWEGLSPLDEQVWRSHISAKWIDETRVFFNEHFQVLEILGIAGAGRYRNGPGDQHYYLAATNQLGDTVLGKRLKLKHSSENDSQSDARADAELFAEWFRFGVQGLPFPNGHIIDEFFDGVIDGDGDGFVFDGTDQERRA